MNAGLNNRKNVFIFNTNNKNITINIKTFTSI